MIKLLAKFLALLNSNQQPSQVALSLVLGMILGLTPLMMPHNLVVLLLIILLRVNFSAILLSLVVFSGVGYLLDPVSNQIGLMILHNEALQPMFTDLYNNGIWRLAHFNNSVVMGSVVLAYGLSIPAFVLFWVFIKTYRQRFLIWVNKFKFVKLLKAANSAKWVAGVVK